MEVNVRRKSILSRVSRPVFWAAGSGVLALLAIAGLYALAPVNYKPPQLRYYICFFLLSLFWASWVTLVVSLNCWISLKLIPPNRMSRSSAVTQANQFVEWTEQETLREERYAWEMNLLREKEN